MISQGRATAGGDETRGKGEVRGGSWEDPSMDGEDSMLEQDVDDGCRARDLVGWSTGGGGGTEVKGEMDKQFGDGEEPKVV